MKSIPSYEIIDQKLADPHWSPKPYSYGKWFIDKLLDMGFYWEDDTPPHFRVRVGNIKVVVSPFPNMVIVDEVKRGFTFEIYYHPEIPQNETEFQEFWDKIKDKI